MEHEETYNQMMDHLDGQLGERGRRELMTHLQACPPCQREWQAIQAVHQLFLQAPLVSPAPGFAGRTMALLPDTGYRIWLVSGVYSLLLVTGFAPLAFVVWLIYRFGPALNQPALVRSLVQAGSDLGRLGQAILAACWQGLSDVGHLIGQQPEIAGWLMVMVGVVLLWSSVYRQLTSPQILRASAGSPNGA